MQMSSDVHQAAPGGEVASPLTVDAPLANAPLAGGSFSLNAYLMAFRDAEGMGLPKGLRGFRSSFPLAPRIVCADGFSLSVQATHGAYCSPRQNIGPWHEVEVGFPSAKPELIAQFAECSDAYTETVYPYVDIELVEKLIAMHGGPDDATRAALAKATGAEPAASGADTRSAHCEPSQDGARPNEQGEGA